MTETSRYPLVPGLFVVLSQPKATWSLDEYHDWYNTEHGPLRMRLGCFQVGCRYRSRGLDPPVWIAAYDLSMLSGLDERPYTALRETRSAREQFILDEGLDLLDRRIYKTISSRGKSDGPSPVITVVTFVIQKDLVDQLHAWYEEEHLEHISRIPGWRRSRRFELVESTDQKPGYVELFAVHDFDQSNGLGGLEHEQARSTPWRSRILPIIHRRDSKVFDLVHEFQASDYHKPTDMPTGIEEQKL